MEKIAKKWGIMALLALWLGLTVFAWVKPAGDISEAERRKLAQFPTISLSGILNGSFAGGFESYATDQFPLREVFRSVKSRFHLQFLGQLDNNDIYIVGKAGIDDGKNYFMVIGGHTHSPLPCLLLLRN